MIKAYITSYIAGKKKLEENVKLIEEEKNKWESEIKKIEEAKRKVELERQTIVDENNQLKYDKVKHGVEMERLTAEKGIIT